jgi:hypothetical protein
MKRKIVNPNPQEKHKQRVEEKIHDEDMKEQLTIIEEEISRKEEE